MLRGPSQVQSGLQLYKAIAHARAHILMWLQVEGLHALSMISCGGLHGVAQQQSGALLAWGANQNGVLGLGSELIQSQRVPVPLEKTFASQVSQLVLCICRVLCLVSSSICTTCKI